MAAATPDRTAAAAAPSPGPTRRGRRWPLSVAPMMDRTDRHFRYLLRRLTRRTLLYTEMVTTGAVLKGDRDRLLAYHPDEHPLALQLGGACPDELRASARIAHDLGYDEVNLNVGCPSDRVRDGRFGACLMAEPDRVATAVAAMRAAVPLPVTVKHRLGIDTDGRDDYEHLRAFVATVAAAGCDRFIVHARIAVLAGLSPKQNREIPPLRYDDVDRLKADFPQLAVELNGGVRSLAEARAHLGRGVDGVMIGRAAYDAPAMLLEADQLLGATAAPVESADAAAAAMLPYIAAWLAGGGRLSEVTRHMLTLFAGRPGARAWRRRLSTEAVRPGAGVEVVEAALRAMPPVGLVAV